MTPTSLDTTLAPLEVGMLLSTKTRTAIERAPTIERNPTHRFPASPICEVTLFLSVAVRTSAEASNETSNVTCASAGAAVVITQSASRNTLRSMRVPLRGTVDVAASENADNS